MRKTPRSQFGKDIDKRLVDMDKSNIWLIEMVKSATGLYFDGSYLHKIKVGEKATPKIVQAIREILDIPNEPTS